MTEISEKILYLAKTTGLSNAEIAQRVGCSGRTVRRIAGPEADRILVEKTNEPGPGMAKILLLDIETAPMEVFVWHLWKNNIAPHNVLKSWSILMWSAKWLFHPEVMSQAVTPEEAFNREDSNILPKMWELLDQADIVVAHNGDQFDLRHLNTRFLMNDMYRPSPYRTIDTLNVARKAFLLPSFKLDEMNKELGLTTKADAGFKLWVDAVSGDTKRATAALTKMLHYNQVDVLILEELYLKIRPWINSHPPLSLYIDTDQEICPTCGNDELDWSLGNYYTPAGKYKAFRCLGCGAIGRSRFSALSREERKKLYISIAR